MELLFNLQHKPLLEQFPTKKNEINKIADNGQIYRLAKLCNDIMLPLKMSLDEIVAFLISTSQLEGVNNNTSFEDFIGISCEQPVSLLQLVEFAAIKHNLLDKHADILMNWRYNLSIIGLRIFDIVISQLDLQSSADWSFNKNDTDALRSELDRFEDQLCNERNYSYMKGKAHQIHKLTKKLHGTPYALGNHAVLSMSSFYTLNDIKNGDYSSWEYSILQGSMLRFLKAHPNETASTYYQDMIVNPLVSGTNLI